MRAANHQPRPLQVSRDDADRAVAEPDAIGKLPCRHRTEQPQMLENVKLAPG